MIKRILMLGCYRQGDGYGNACNEYMLAMHEAGLDVVARFVRMTNSTGEYPDLVKEFEKKDLNNVDAVIQHNLPSEFVYKGGVQNIGMFAYETSGFPNTSWQEHISLMDKTVVFYREQAKQFKHHNIHVIPHPIDVDKFHKEYQPIDFQLPRDTLKFYTISEYGRRKNITALLVAYLSEFTCDDNVVLVIKTHVGRDAGTTMQVMKNLIEEVKSGIGKYTLDSDRYPKVIILPEYLTNEQICALHQTCDAFVSASHGEAMCMPFQDAIGFGKPCIVPNHTAFAEYQFPGDKALLVQSFPSPVVGVNNAPPGLYTSDETWFNVNIHSLREKMRLVESKRSQLDFPASERNRYITEVFSRKNVGKMMKEMLNAM